MNFHAKSGVCSSKMTELWVLFYLHTFCTFVLSHLVGQCLWTSMQNLESVTLWVLLYLCTFLYFLYFCNLFGLSIQTSMQNLEYVALKMTELWVLLYLCTFLYFIWTIHTNFHAKSGVCSSKNGWVIALGKKEDTYYIVVYSILYYIKSHEGIWKKE